MPLRSFLTPLPTHQWQVKDSVGRQPPQGVGYKAVEAEQQQDPCETRVPSRKTGSFVLLPRALTLLLC